MEKTVYSSKRTYNQATLFPEAHPAAYVNNYGISVTDDLKCMVSTNGRCLSAFNISGIGSLSDLYRYVKMNFKGIKGVVSLTLRNATQGWSKSMSVFML